MIFEATTEKNHLGIKCVQMIDSLGTGGAQRMVVLLAYMCAEKKIPFTVISLANDPDSDNAREIRSYSGRVVNFPANRLLDINRLISIRNFLCREKFDLMHSYLTYANIIGCLSGSLAGLPVISSLRNLRDSPLHYHPGRRFIETFCLNFLAKRVMSNGYAIAQVNSQRIKTKDIDIIPNAIVVPELISSEERKTIREELVGDNSRPIIISTGRLVPLKGFADLIDAINSVKDIFPDIVLLIAGSGVTLPELENQVKKLGLSNHVKLLGYRKDIPRLLQASDVYVSASISEGMSVAILEAMAGGVPVITTDVGDATRVVIEGTGVIVPIHRPDMIASTLVSFLKDPDCMKQMGIFVRLRVCQNYNPEKWLKDILALYDKAVSKR